MRNATTKENLIAAALMLVFFGCFVAGLWGMNQAIQDAVEGHNPTPVHEWPCHVADVDCVPDQPNGSGASLGDE